MVLWGALAFQLTFRLQKAGMANSGFVERAPAALVEEIRAKRTNSQSKLANIEQSIKALG
jgi:valyl-tRNA synthetase